MPKKLQNQKTNPQNQQESNKKVQLRKPTSTPVEAPSEAPQDSYNPTPQTYPTAFPISATEAPTSESSRIPTTLFPQSSPTEAPTNAPFKASELPTFSPSIANDNKTNNPSPFLPTPSGRDDDGFYRWDQKSIAIVTLSLVFGTLSSIPVVRWIIRKCRQPLEGQPLLAGAGNQNLSTSTSGSANNLTATPPSSPLGNQNSSRIDSSKAGDRKRFPSKSFLSGGSIFKKSRRGFSALDSTADVDVEQGGIEMTSSGKMANSAKSGDDLQSPSSSSAKAGSISSQPTSPKPIREEKGDDSLKSYPPSSQSSSPLKQRPLHLFHAPLPDSAEPKKSPKNSSEDLINFTGTDDDFTSSQNSASNTLSSNVSVENDNSAKLHSPLAQDSAQNSQEVMNPMLLTSSEVINFTDHPTVSTSPAAARQQSPSTRASFIFGSPQNQPSTSPIISRISDIGGNLRNLTGAAFQQVKDSLSGSAKKEGRN